MCADGRARILSDPADNPRHLLRARYAQYAEVAVDGPVVEIAVTRWSGWRSALS